MVHLQKKPSVYTQWNYSYFFPSVATDCHVTNWSDVSVKYKVDVASMGKLGFDIVAHELTEEELQFCKQAIQNYNSFKDVVWKGDLFRLVDHHENDMASIVFVSQDKDRAVMFNYVVNPQVKNILVEAIKLAGLDVEKKYRVKEINLWPDSRSKIDTKQSYSGEFMMNVRIKIDFDKTDKSIIFEINAI